jgi:diguanylate cyclase (GGDEF)-like protein
MHARHGRPRPPGAAGRLRLPPSGPSRGLRLQRLLLTGYLLLSAVALKVSVLIDAERVPALAVIVGVTVVVVGHLALGWNWDRLWMVTLVAIGVMVLALVVLPLPHAVLGFLFAVLAKASLDPVGARAGALCGGALLVHLAVVSLLAVTRSWSTATLWMEFVTAPGLAVLVALQRLYVNALAQRDDAVRRLELSVQSDPLTGAASRDHFATRLAEATTGIAPSARPAVLMIDLDRFKAVNDTWGHRAGDELLRIVAARLHDVVGGDGLVARLGGDEFAVLLPDTTTARANHLLALLHERLAQPASVLGIPVRPGASIGLAIRDRGEEVTASTLLHRADLDMYVSKRRGRDGGDGREQRHTTPSAITPHPERN